MYIVFDTSPPQVNNIHITSIIFVEIVEMIWTAANSIMWLPRVGLGDL